MHPVYLPAHWPNVRRMINRERPEGGRKREGGREREGEREGGKLSYLKRDVLTILQSNHLLSPVQKVCVIDNIGPKLWMVQDTRVVQLQIVHLWTDKPVTQTGLPGSLPRQAGIAGGRQSADCYTNCRRLSTRHCLQRRRKEVPGLKDQLKVERTIWLVLWGKGVKSGNC